MIPAGDLNRKEVQKNCTRFLTLHKRKSPKQILADLAEKTPPEMEADFYGEGEFIKEFEERVACLLGFESAVFMPSGTMAQQIALRIWSEDKNCSRVAWHPLSHLEVAEERAYSYLHGLTPKHVGTTSEIFTPEDLEQLNEPISSLLVELPQRFLGGELHPWEDLVAFKNWCKENNVAYHLDGARLWECVPFYKKELSEIAGLFDSVYVSFYKGLGGIAGSILAGPTKFIQRAKIWQKRHGGNLIYQYPYVLAAELGLKEHLPKMALYHKKAMEVAEVLNSIPEIKTTPRIPPTNMMHVYIKGEAKELLARALEISSETKIWLFANLKTHSSTGYCSFEWSVGDATLEISNEEIREIFASLIK